MNIKEMKEGEVPVVDKDMPYCGDNICNNGSTYWATTQMCSQSKVWNKTPPYVALVPTYGGDLCYCSCDASKRYCNRPNCVKSISDIITNCTTQGVAYQDFVTMAGSDGVTGKSDCQCPCPNPMCNYCSDPQIADYIRSTCKTYGWWSGYPIVMAGEPISDHCTCLCPDDTAQAMWTFGLAQEHLALETLKLGDGIRACDLTGAWRSERVGSKCELSTMAPTQTIRLMAANGFDVVVLAEQHLLLETGQAVPARTLSVGDSIAQSLEGDTLTTSKITTIEHRPAYAYPLVLVAIADDERAQGARFLSLNGFLVEEYGTFLSRLFGI